MLVTLVTLEIIINHPQNQLFNDNSAKRGLLAVPLEEPLHLIKIETSSS